MRPARWDVKSAEVCAFGIQKALATGQFTSDDLIAAKRLIDKIGVQRAVDAIHMLARLA